MHKGIGILLGVALLLPAATGLVSDADARARTKYRPEVKALLTSPTFEHSGEFSGTLAGAISIGGAICRVGRDAVIYEVGRGVMPVGTTLEGRMVSVSGIVRDNTKIVYQVIVRPGPMDNTRGDRSRFIKTQEPGAPK